jgi:hypothetical protein
MGLDFTKCIANAIDLLLWERGGEFEFSTMLYDFLFENVTSI